MTLRVVAIDGPSASGKSSTGAAVALALGLIHVDSGALYRALGRLATRAGDDPAAILALAEAEALHLAPVPGALVVRAGTTDLEGAIRTPEASAGASRIAVHPALRDWVNARLRRGVAGAGGAVLDGRDIGTVVFPDAPLKVFLTATPEARARRRLQQTGREDDREALRRETEALAERDRRDASRPVAPLRPAEDAVLLDGTTLSLAEQVARIVALARLRGLSAG